MNNPPLNQCYYNIKRRVKNKNDKYYPRYGGRGITICKQWDKSFLSFKNWALANGYKQGLTIERKNNNKNYSPANCCWITNQQQHENREVSIYITYKGERKHLNDWSKIVGIKRATLYYRIIIRNWPTEKAFYQPIRI